MVDILTNNVPLENKRFSRRITMKNKEIREKLQKLSKEYIGDIMCDSLVDQIMQIVEEEREKVRVQEIKDILKVIKDLNKRSEKGDLVGMGDLEDMLKGYLIDLSSLKAEHVKT